jgi:hypothetical protein
MKTLLLWLDTHRGWLWWVAGASIVTFVVTLAAIPILVVRMEADYFMRSAPPPESWRRQHPAVRFVLRATKNTIGATLVLAGLVLSLPLIPGQGILTIMIGLSLLEFPGKRALELRLARQGPVRRAINWIRARARRPPLILPEQAEKTRATRRACGDA